MAPNTRKKHILTMGHDTVGGHMSAKRTEQRISLSFWWPGLAKDCTEYVQTCTVCQKKARITYKDRVPIKAIPRADRIFDHWFVECIGPLLSGEGPKPGGSCNSGSIRRRSRMWMNSRSDWLKFGLVWSRTLLTLLSMRGETVCMLVYA